MEGLDIVVCNYRTAEDLRDFCQSLIRFPPKRPYSLTVVNVCPQQPDLMVGDWAEEEFGAHHLCFEENVGYGRGCNAGALKGDRAHLAFFNADVVLEEGALEQCCQALEENPRWGVVGPRQVDAAGRMTHAGIFGSMARPVHRAWHSPDSSRYHDIVQVPTVSGAAYFIPREVWSTLTNCPIFQQSAPGAEGAFLPTSHYWNETYTSYHAWTHGWKVIYYGPVRVVHKWHRASPVGGPVDQGAEPDRVFFRQACEAHGMAHD